ncbi:V-type proton ATPase subunit E [subsurface metagenome]
MKGMEKISEAILDKVRVDAQQIIEKAEEKAYREMQKAQEQRERKFEEEKRKRVEKAGREATRILAQAFIEARREVSKAKADIIDEIINRAKKVLAGISSNENSSLSLIKEAVDGLGNDKARIYVSPKDVSTIQNSIKRDEELASRIIEIKEFDCTGGVIAESIDGKIRIDNTYDARLEMLLPQILPEIGKELFQGL